MMPLEERIPKMFATAFDRGCMLVLGGARSGKSGFALNAGNALARKRWFVATARAGDDEMAERIRMHRADRGAAWATIEEPVRLAETIESIDAADTVIVVDCLTLWLSNLFMRHGQDQGAVEDAVAALCSGLSRVTGAVILVSNEVGLGIVPGDALSRRFRDTAGWMNRLVAERAVKVAALFAGLPMVLKDA
jgi:adenosylcobinamide kinase/adenosylcobinamide-phosphate guanylyltransferase